MYKNREQKELIFSSNKSRLKTYRGWKSKNKSLDDSKRVKNKVDGCKQVENEIDIRQNSKPWK
jgi:hypothetical protein